MQNIQENPAALDRVRRYAEGAGISFGDELFLFYELDRERFLSSPLHLSFLTVSYCAEGEADVVLDDRTFHAQKGDLLLSLAGHDYHGAALSDDFRGQVLLVNPLFVQDSVAGMSHVWPYILHLLNKPLLPLTEDEQRWMERCFRTLRFHLTWDSGRYRRETLLSLVRSFCFVLSSMMDRRLQVQPQERQVRAYAIFDGFFRLLTENFLTQRSVSWYGEQLCLSPKHLSEMVRTVSGQSAGTWIQYFVIAEAKRLLHDTSLSLKEIYVRLNFSSQSFFGKYFKNVTGCSPLEYRRRVLM